MKEKIQEFWKEHKDTIKNVTIMVSVSLAGLSLIGVNRLNKVIEENDLTELFYGEEE